MDEIFDVGGFPRVHLISETISTKLSAEFHKVHNQICWNPHKSIFFS